MRRCKCYGRFTAHEYGLVDKNTTEWRYSIRGRLGSGLRDHQTFSKEICMRKFLNGNGPGLFIIHFNKTKSFGKTSSSVDNNFYRIDFAKLRKQSLQGTFTYFTAYVCHKKIHRND